MAEKEIKISRYIVLTISDEMADKIVNEIDHLEVMYDKEYIGGPYDEIQNLQKLKDCIEKHE